jgi:hypothetical protein
VKREFSLAKSGSQPSVINYAAGLASATASKTKKETITMRKQLFKALAICGLFLTLAVGSVQAQTGYKIEVNIPFDFTAGKASQPSGIYSVNLISEYVLLVRSIDGKKSVLVLANRTIEPESTQEPERIIYNRYGDRYFLSQIWLNRRDAGSGFNPSSAERRLANEHRVAQGDAKPQKVDVAVVAVR